MNLHWWDNILHWYDHKEFGFIEQYLLIKTVKPTGTVSCLDGRCSTGIHPRWVSPEAWYEKQMRRLAYMHIQLSIKELQERH